MAMGTSRTTRMLQSRAWVAVVVAGTAVVAVVAAIVAWRRREGMANSALPTPSATSSAMVIVEPREHKHLQYVVENFDAIMPVHYDLYVFHGASAGAFARRCVAGITRRRVVLVPLHTDNLTADEYNELFKQPQFWSTVDAENILVFQTDAVLCPRSPWSIADFERYGYVGCAYDGTAGPGTHWGATHAFWGVGGLSFRKKSMMMRCIRELPHAPPDPEDVFYSDCVERFGKHKNGNGHGSGANTNNNGAYLAPDAPTLSQFCSQNTYLAPSFGAHRLHDMMDKTQLPDFVEFCPAATSLLDM